MMAESSRRARRGARSKQSPTGQHRSLSRGDFGRSFAALGSLAYAGARVSAHVFDLQTGTPLLAIDDRIVQPVGAVGSVLLLIEVSARLSAGESGFALIDRVWKPADIEPDPNADTAEDARAVADSDTTAPSARTVEPPQDKQLPGLWNLLVVPALPVVDLAVLVGATRDAVATNALLRQVTLASVRLRGETLGFSHTAVLDLMRATRGPDDAPHFAVASAVELASMMAGLQRGEIVDPITSARVLRWLGANRQATLVAAALGPSAAGDAADDQSFRWLSSLGVEPGLRAEAGLMFGSKRVVAFAVIIEFDADSVATQLAAVDALRVVGLDLLEYLAEGA